MRTHYLKESEDLVLELTEAEAQDLRALGRRLASKKEWWGQEQQGDELRERSAIRCEPLGSGQWQVRVADAIGLISVGTVQLCVQPKIPIAHLVYLMNSSGHLPRLDEQATRAAAGHAWWDLVASWYPRAMQAVLRRDLIRDYRAERFALTVVRGRLHPLPTMRSIYPGRVALDCEYEEFDADNSLNRVLKAAARRIIQSPMSMWVATPPEEVKLLRLLGLRIVARMDEVGELRPNDLRTEVDLRTSYYADALALARHLLQGIDLEFGRADSRAFLIRTPDLVETGIRNLLQDEFKNWNIRKEGRQVEGSSATLNPDLVIGADLAVADVKYKILDSDWNRADLYQIVTFATGFHTQYGALVGFTKPEQPMRPSPIRIGPVNLCVLAWPADSALKPRVAAGELMAEVGRWLLSTRN